MYQNKLPKIPGYELLGPVTNQKHMVLQNIPTLIENESLTLWHFVVKLSSITVTATYNAPTVLWSPPNIRKIQPYPINKKESNSHDKLLTYKQKFSQDREGTF